MKNLISQGIKGNILKAIEKGKDSPLGSAFFSKLVEERERESGERGGVIIAHRDMWVDWAKPIKPNCSFFFLFRKLQLPSFGNLQTGAPILEEHTRLNSVLFMGNST